MATIDGAGLRRARRRDGREDVEEPRLDEAEGREEQHSGMQERRDEARHGEVAPERLSAAAIARCVRVRSLHAQNRAFRVAATVRPGPRMSGASS